MCSFQQASYELPSVQKGKIKQVDVGITCTQENHRKLGLEGI